MSSEAALGDVRRQRRHRLRSGFTFVETLIAASTILAGLLVIASGAVRAKCARVAAEQQIAAATTLERAAAQLRAGSIGNALTLYAPSPNGLPYPAHGSGPGAAFVAAGLADAADPAQPAQVSVRFFTDETEANDAVGLPRDLDGDGMVSDTDTARLGGDGQPVARIVPFELTLTYRGPGGGSVTAMRRGVLTHVR
jgi:Tfp pilus assembly protein PilV